MKTPSPFACTALVTLLMVTWGHPNLEGIWLDVYDTPFERPAELGEREFATPEERAARDQARMVNPGS